jgi:RNA polymerase sigma factor (sigma-70 family)
MVETGWLAERFEAHRARLRTVAYRMLGSQNEADDAVQESWLRLSRSAPGDIENLAGWLTTVVARVCLNMLQSRRSRREELIGTRLPDTTRTDGATDPEEQALLADSVGLALLVVLDTLAPAERVAFVLHDMFAVSFEEIAPIVGRSPTAARQLASRARRRVQGGTVPVPDLARQRQLVDAFLVASRGGEFEALLSLLDPDVVLRVDRVARGWAADAAALGAAPLAPEIHGAPAVAGIVSGRAHGVRLALIDGAVGAAWESGGRLRAVFGFTVEDGRITEIDMVADPARLDQLDVVVL